MEFVKSGWLIHSYSVYKEQKMTTWADKRSKAISAAAHCILTEGMWKHAYAASVSSQLVSDWRNITVPFLPQYISVEFGEAELLKWLSAAQGSNKQDGHRNIVS